MRSSPVRTPADPFATTEPNRIPRVPFEGSLRLEDGNLAVFAQAANLSSGGIGVRLNRPPAVGHTVAITLETAKSELPLGEAEIVWREPTEGTHKIRCGLKFTKLNPRAAALIEAIVRHGGTPLTALLAIPSDEEPTKPEARPLSGLVTVT